MLSAIIGMAHALRLTVTAESVDDAYQAARLRALGCDTAQGRLYGRPPTPEEFDAQLDGVPLPPRRAIRDA